MLTLTLRFLNINKRVVPLITIIMSIFTYFSIIITLLSFTYVSATLSAKAHQPLRGDMIKCQNEGESVKVSLLSDDPCFTCKCSNQEIVCQREVCPNFKACYLLYYGKNRTCCDVCKGCLYGGRYYKSGEKFNDPNDLCRNFVCNAGVITEYRPHCHVPCGNAVTIPGQCCPSCGNCEVNGRTYKDGDQIPNASHDPCISCECVKGNMICSKSACQVLSCPQSKWITPKNECCPICKGHRKVHDFEGNCIMGLSAYRDGHSYVYDQCTNCICNATTNICQRKVCPPLDCPPMYQIIEPEECCPKCHEPQEAQTTCTHEGKEYKTGDKWKHKNCHKCSCINGEVRCTAVICSKELICPNRYKLTRLNGDCCDSCVEDDSQCKLTENMTNYHTFDGKEYTFDGKCNYILARDCKSKSFSIHLVNRYQNETLNFEMRNSSFIAGSSIMVKIDDIKVRLGALGKVNVGRKRVRLPHIRLGILSIVRDAHKIVLRANIGVKVIWDAGNSVEIIVPPDYKSRTCGLCGNYNNNPDDDFLTKRGLIVTEVEKLTHSWKVGKNVICPNPMDNTKALKDQTKCTFKDWEQRFNAINVCNILKSSLFKQCHTSISITPYFGKCLSDVCSCHKNQVCHCTAVQTYANQCQKLGFYNQHWKKKTLCQAMNCPKGAVFSTCTSACKRTCNNNLNNRKQRNCRKRKCRPGCECPIGQVWHNGKCIYKQLCPTRQILSTQTTTPSLINQNILKEELIT